MLRKGDFVEIEYAGYDKESGKLFDVTSEEIARKEGVYDPNFSYKPLTICLGEGHVLEGLDDTIIGKEDSRKYTFEILPEHGFGKRNQKLLKLVSLELFRKQNIRPFFGLVVSFDGAMGTVRTVSGGRIVVDFNHPLAGHVLIYDVIIGKTIDDTQKKIEVVLKFGAPMLSGKYHDNCAELTGIIAEEHVKHIHDTILRLIPEIREVKFIKQ